MSNSTTPFTIAERLKGTTFPMAYGFDTDAERWARRGPSGPLPARLHELHGGIIENIRRTCETPDGGLHGGHVERFLLPAERMDPRRILQACSTMREFWFAQTAAPVSAAEFVAGLPRVPKARANRGKLWDAFEAVQPPGVAPQESKRELFKLLTLTFGKPVRSGVDGREGFCFKGVALLG
ncbi:hypothetical protein ACFVXH_40910 [Kitasatospora sp. NPDC058184]|uniref:hypothetical protein n=1 Tax=Kitasatospora sp. NPDC058184 TaxID=3346370 RepID=UPI0036DE5C14